MIAETDITNKLISQLLGCGWMDTKFIVDMIDTYENHKFKIDGVEKYLNTEGTFIEDIFYDLDEMTEIGEKPSVNAVIYSAYRIVTLRILHHYSDRLECEDFDELFEFSVNCMASNLTFLMDDIDKIPWHKDAEITDDEKIQLRDEIEDIVLEF